MPDAEKLADLKAREEELDREWSWLNELLNRMARFRAEEAEPQTFRLLQEQHRVIGQRRVELMMEVAHLEHGKT